MNDMSIMTQLSNWETDCMKEFISVSQRTIVSYGAFVFTDSTRETTVHGVVKGAPVHLVSPSFQHITNVDQGKAKVVIRIPFVISIIGKGY